MPKGIDCNEKRKLSDCKVDNFVKVNLKLSHDDKCKKIISSSPKLSSNVMMANNVT
jgi:hypothetical protein